MTHDQIVLTLVGIEAQLRRVQRIACATRDPVEFSRRVSPLIGEVARNAHSLMDRIEHSEGVKHAHRG